MKNIEDVLLFTDIKEIAKRQELIYQMVGQLYPSILWDEITRLRMKCMELSEGISL
jgi:hypothetical protein